MADLNSYTDTVVIPWLSSHGLRILLIVVGGFLLNQFLQRFIVKIVQLSVTLDRHKSVEAEQKRERTLIRVFTWASLIIIVIVGAMMILQEIGIPIGPMLAGAGILGLAVGFGGQYLIRDYITGVLIIFENQYQIGDIVEIDTTSGTVEDISLRLTTLRDLDGTVHLIPHGDIKRVSNFSKIFSRINININVSYEASLNRVIRVINEVGNEMAADAEWKEVIIKPPQFLRVDDFTDTAVIIKVVGDTIPNQQWAAAGELRRRIKDAFDREEIEMPYLHRVVQHIDKSGKDHPDT